MEGRRKRKVSEFDAQTSAASDLSASPDLDNKDFGEGGDYSLGFTSFPDLSVRLMVIGGVYLTETNAEASELLQQLV